MNIQYTNLPEENSRIWFLCFLFLAGSSFFVLDLFHDLAHFWNGALELGNCLARSFGLNLLKLRKSKLVIWQALHPFYAQLVG